MARTSRSARGSRRSRTAFRVYSVVDVTNLGLDANQVLLDEGVDNLLTGQGFPPGELEGFTVDLTHENQGNGEAGARIVVLVVPLGIAVPYVGTRTAMLQQQQYIWADISLPFVGIRSTLTYSSSRSRLARRKFDYGDRIAVVIVNNTPALFGPTSLATCHLRGWVT